MTTGETEKIAERVERGRKQNSTENGAIVPFPFNADFHDPISMMSNFDRQWLTNHQNNGYVLTPYVYRIASGEPIFVLLRVDHPDKEKDVRPLRCDRVLGIRPIASLKHLEGLRPLYNLDQIAARPADPVLVVEGEKAADAAQTLCPEYVCTTWAGGAQSVKRAELLPLVDRDVTIWPDNDSEGLKAARTFAAELLRLRVS